LRDYSIDFNQTEVIIMAKEANPKRPRRRATLSSEALQEMIGKKAYELYEKRGREHGCELDDWLEAEKIVKSAKKS
jgi:hypothetical protein